MIPFGQLVEELEANLRKHGADDKAQIRRSLNLVIRDFVARHPFAAWRRAVSLDFSTGTDSTDNGLILPADLCRIWSVWDTSNSREYHQTDQGYGRGETQTTTQASNPRYRWMYVAPVATPLYRAKNCTVSTNSTTFTSAGEAASWIGEYCTFGSQLGIYKITDTATISPAFTGESIQNGYITVRPTGTRRMAILSYTNAVSTATVLVTYSVFPHPYTLDEDIVPFPTSRALELAAMIKIVGEKDKKRLAGQNWLEQLPVAWEELVMADSPIQTPRPPVDRTGFNMRFR